MTTKLTSENQEALVLRNRIVTEAFHAVTPRLILRRRLLQALSYLPIRQSHPSKQERILLIRPDHLGDLILTTPAIHELRKAKPLAEIHALVGSWSASALENNDDIDRVLTLDFPGFQRGEKPPLFAPYRLAWKTARQLRQLRYSAAVILRPDHWWGAMVTFLAGIPIRIGHQHPNTALFLTDVHRSNKKHAVQQASQLMEKWADQLGSQDLQLQFKFIEDDRMEVSQLLQSKGISSNQRIFCIHPGSGTWVKRWNATRWAVVADTLIDQLNAAVLITGSASESNLAQNIINRMDQAAYSVTGQTTFSQLAALFARSLVVLGPDSGPLHLAAAVKTPTVALFGPADPEEFAPWGPSSHHTVLTTDIGCRPCRVLDWGDDPPENHPCVQSITIGQVLEAARRVTSSSA